MRLIYALTVVLVILTAGTALSQETGDWHVYMDASAVNRITCLGDSLWCATRGGILLFDLQDSTFTHYMDGLGLNHGNVSSVVTDGGGNIWGGFTSGGVFRIFNTGSDPSVEVYTEVRNGILSDSITCMLSVGEDVYYGSEAGVAKFYNNFPSDEEVLTDSLLSRKVYDITAKGDSLLVGCSEGLAYFDRNDFSYQLDRIGKVTSISLYQGKVYCIVNDQVVTNDGGAWSAVGSFPLTPLEISSGGGVLACTSANKVFRWNGTDWEEVYGYDIYDPRNIRDVLFKRYRVSRRDTDLEIFRTIAVDDNGTTWVGGVLDQQKRGTYISGASGAAWFNKSPEQLTQNEIIELSLDPEGGIWYSSRHFGIGYLGDEGNRVNYTSYRGDIEGDNGLSYFAYNLGLLMDSSRNLWIMSPHYYGDRDMDMIDVGVAENKADDQWSHLSPGEEITSDLFVKIKEDPGGNIWFLADEVGVMNIRSADGNNWLYIGEEDGLESGKTFDCAFGEGGKVYLALRDYGVQVWDVGGYSWQFLEAGGYWYTLMSEELASTELHSVELGDDGTVWVGTAAGVVSYRDGVIDSLTIRDQISDEGLVGSIARDLERDGNGNIWVASDGGIDVIGPEGDVIKTYTSFSYWNQRLQLIYSERVISPLISPVCNALEYHEGDNTMWIGTDNGMYSLDLSAGEEEEIPLSRMILYPNPIHIYRDNSLKISRISGSVDIEIYTLEGELVHQIDDVSDGDTVWELLTMNGYKVASGIYLVKVDAAGTTQLRKVAVIK